jgi:hypothetical protein
MGKKLDDANKAVGILSSVAAIGGVVLKIISATQKKK